MRHSEGGRGGKRAGKGGRCGFENATNGFGPAGRRLGLLLSCGDNRKQAQAVCTLPYFNCFTMPSCSTAQIPHLLELAPEELDSWFRQRDQPSYRAGQLWQWVFRHRAESFQQMSNLPRRLRQELQQRFRLWSTRKLAHQQASDGTEKLLLELADGHRVECVLLRQGPRRRTVCISTQVGCAMGCVFCASGLDGVVRNLTRGEILEQVLRLDRLLSPQERLSHVVVMGMGEPLANLQELIPALDLLTSPQGLGLSHRRVTISTVGLPAGIRRLAQLDRPYHLAVSLHAPTDALRTQLVPVNRSVGIESVLEAVDEYFQKTGRRVTFEYVLLGGVNDSPQAAWELGRLLRRRRPLVNLIPYNPVSGLPYRAPDAARVRRFAEELKRQGVEVQLRRRKGAEIDAACGQLRRRHGSS